MNKKFNWLGAIIILCCVVVVAFGANRCGKQQAKDKLKTEINKSLFP